VGLADRDYTKAEPWQREQRERLAEWQWRRFPWSAGVSRRGRFVGYLVAAVLATGPAVAIGYAVGAEIGPFAPEPLLVWGGHEFESKGDFEAWLRAHGGSYEGWAAKHPAAAAKLETRR
jgi:hypothetical protein